MSKCIIEELEAMRRRQINIINAEFDELRRMLEHSGETNITEEPKELYVTLPLRGGSSAFKGKSLWK